MAKGLFDKIKGALVEEESGVKVKTAASDTPVFGARNTDHPPYPARGVTWPPAAPPPPPPTDPALIADVEQRLSAQSGTAYTQFGTLLSNLSAVTDERVRFQSAISVARTTLNLTPEQIRQAFEERLNILNRIETAFKEKSHAEHDKRVGSGQAERIKVDDELNRIAAEQARLQTRRTELEAKHAEITQRIEQDRAEVEQISQQMQVALDIVRAKATAERDTVARNITGGVA